MSDNNERQYIDVITLCELVRSGKRLLPLRVGAARIPLARMKHQNWQERSTQTDACYG
jgi:hypothetical protein